jgi:hypothetical protein
MKKLITMAALAVAGIAQAGDYHNADELKCQQCHTMHASRAHGFEIITATGNVATSTTVYTPQDNLLIAAGTNETCLACHDKNSGGYDVFGVGGTTNGVRSAGALNGTVGAHVAKTAGPEFAYADQTGHTMNSTATAPGGSFANALGFNCADCHAVHGNAAYRNLGDTVKGFTADQQPSYATTTTVALYEYDVVESEPEAYDTREVAFGYGNGANRMNAYCGKCHGNFHGDGNVNGAGGNFKRHPTGTATSAFDFDGTTARYTPNEAVRAVQTSATDVSPGCLSCHKAHGNKRAFGLIHPTPGQVGGDLENGDLAGVIDHTGTRTFYNPKPLCATCHFQGK